MPAEASETAETTPPAAGAAAPSAPPPEPKEDWETRFKYLLADFENFRRRSAKEKEAATQQARGALLRELLPLVDAFQAASAAVERMAPADPVRKGLELLDREWGTFLRHEGVEPTVSVGQPFHAGEAEAVGEGPTTDGAPDGTVREVVQQGYRFFGGLLRPAKVIVARARNEAPPAPSAEPEGPEAGA